MENNKFAFRCYYKLKDALGRFDSVVECNELAVRQFVESLNCSDNKEKFFSESYAKYGVRVNSLDSDVFHTRISQWYILSVYQQAEDFFTEFRREHPDGSTWGKRNDKESQLAGLMRVLSLNELGLDPDGQGIRCKIFEYYRLIRNRFMHTSVNEKQLSTALKDIEDHSVSVDNEFRVNAPNSYNSVRFDDFILFSRVTKDIAQQLCYVKKPLVSGIVEMLIKRSKAEDDLDVNLKGLKVFANNPNRLRKALSRLLKSQYNLQESEVDAIMEELMKRGLLVQRKEHLLQE